MSKKMLIIYGGKSTEHDVSIITALQMYKKYQVSDYEKVLVYITKNGEWLIGDGLSEFKFYKDFDGKKLKTVSLKIGDKNLYLVKKNKFKPLFKVDFILNCCHGGDGENGNLVSLFEMCGIPSSTGDGKSLQVLMDKYLTKLALVANDIPTIDFFVVEKSDWILNRDKIKAQLEQFGLPVVVKPCAQGSSVGVCMVSSVGEFDKAVNLGFDFGVRVIVEKAIVEKREFNCAVMRKNGKIITSKIEEPIAKNTIISFSDKYLVGGVGKGAKCGAKQQNISLGMESGERKFPADISKKLEKKIMNISSCFYSLLNANGVVRVDFIYDCAKEKIYLGEANAIPGSLGYYFFQDSKFLEDIIYESCIYWRSMFFVKTTTPIAKIF